MNTSIKRKCTNLGKQSFFEPLFSEKSEYWSNIMLLMTIARYYIKVKRQWQFIIN